MKDYRVTVKVRNNRILKAIEALGGTPGQKWCVANGLTYNTVNDFINMVRGPLTPSGALKESAQELCDVLNKLPEDLWSNDQLYPLERHMSDVELDRKEMTEFLPMAEQSYLPDFSDFEQRQVRSLLDKAIDTLSERHAKILRLRFYDEITLDDAAKVLSVSRERARQIEEKALRLLRQPSRLATIVDCVGADVVSDAQRAKLKEQARKDAE